MAVTLRRRHLLDLPDELLIQILSVLPSQHDLFSVCLVSRRMNSLTDPVLHKSILFDQPKHHLTFSESLLTRPRRGSLIQNVRIEYPSSELSEFMFLTEERGPGQVDRFSHTLSTMSNLEDLVISVPDTLCRAIGNLFNHPFDLACLKSCETPVQPCKHCTDILGKASCIITAREVHTGTSRKTSTSSRTQLSRL